MDGKFMEFYAEVHHVGSSSGFHPPGPSTDLAPSHVLALEDATMQDYNSGEDSDYEEDSSCHSTEEDKELNIDTRHVEDPSMEDVDVEYNMDGGVEFMVGHRMRNRDAVLMAVKNYSIRRNAEYKGGPKDRVAAHVSGLRHVGRSLSARQHVDHECRAAPGQDKSFSVGPFVAECYSTKLSFQTIVQKSVDGEEEGDVTVVWRF
ncbi:hypothetical protein PIB30_088649 [Stylosanthes scabra]|uniref:Uncharacterized protein n=1 Tax=Stylosanthes scabra TaxID=79078 RepID=A0ABU6SU24_9FABA|nr:hypothetical protein [Stylosanthes scabra]